MEDNTALDCVRTIMVVKFYNCTSTKRMSAALGVRIRSKVRMIPQECHGQFVQHKRQKIIESKFFCFI